MSLGVGRNVGGGLGDEDDNRPGQQDDNQTNNGGGNNPLRFFNVLFISSGRQPDEPAVDDEDHGNQGHQTEGQSDNVKNRIFQIGVTQTNLATD